MPLAHYSVHVFYPGGGFAAERAMPVRLFGSNRLAALFSDKAGTTPMENPATTDRDGLLSFFAAPGVYQTEFAGETLLIPVDATETDEVTPGVFVHEQQQADTLWQVSHFLGSKPSVTVEAGEKIAPFTEVRYVDENSLTITFAAPVAGTARLRR